MFSLLANPVAVGITGVVIALLIVAVIIVKRYRVANPDEAIIVTGRKGKTTTDESGQILTDLSGQKVVTGGGIFVLPFVQKSFNLSLRSRRLTITTTAQTTNGITIQARAVAVVKVGGSESMIRAAAQRFLSQQNEIESSTQEVLSGSLRGIIGGLTVEQIIRDRAALASAVLSAAEDALTKQGLVVDTLQIQEINDDQDYIKNLGRPESANVRQRAEIADTEATRASESARIDAQKIILDKNRELRLREAAIQTETDKALAAAQAAKPLEDAVQRQQIVAQEELTAQREAALKEQRLNAEVRKVADAEAYRIKITAQAEADANVKVADAARQSREFAAAAMEREGAAQKVSRQAAAEALQSEGLAEAASISARGKAEADTIKARGEALAEQAQAVLAQQAIETLPLIAKELASTYGAIDNLTVVSADGANKLTGDVVSNVKSVTTMLKDATGIDVTGIINGVAAGSAAGNALGKAKGSKKESIAPNPTPIVTTHSNSHEVSTDNSVEEDIHAIDSLVDNAAAQAVHSLGNGSNAAIEETYKQLDKIERVLASLEARGLNYESLPESSHAKKKIDETIVSLESLTGASIEAILASYPRISQLVYPRETK